MTNNTAETILVSRSGDVLVIGRKLTGKPLEVINAFEGKEAEELWEKLTVKKEETNETT